MSKSELVREVRHYAGQHYAQGGWDYVVESLSDSEIEEEIGKANTAHGAISNVAKLVKLLNDRREDVQGEVF